MLEVGVIEHQGHRFAAYGATCNGKHLTAYCRQNPLDRMELTTWKGEALCELRYMQGREYSIDDFGGSGQAVLMRCGNGHFIGGLALDLGLFRGEHFLADDDQDAMQQAEAIAEGFAELDFKESREPEEEPLDG